MSENLATSLTRTELDRLRTRLRVVQAAQERGSETSEHLGAAIDHVTKAIEGHAAAEGKQMRRLFGARA